MSDQKLTFNLEDFKKAARYRGAYLFPRSHGKRFLIAFFDCGETAEPIKLSGDFLGEFDAILYYRGFRAALKMLFHMNNSGDLDFSQECHLSAEQYFNRMNITELELTACPIH